MRKLFRNVLIYTIAFYVLSGIIAGVVINGGLPAYIVIGFVFTLIDGVIKPVLKILTLPLNLITFGVFSFFLNVILLYVLTLFVPFITITQFTFAGASFAGFIVPKIYFNDFFAFVVASLIISLIVSAVSWAFEK